jgi:hypothetical protein
MLDEHLVHAVVLLVILWLCMIWYWLRQRSQSTTCQTTPTPAQPPQKRSRDPKPFPGRTHTPHWAACEGGGQVPTKVLASDPPSLRVSTQGCPRPVDTQRQFCPSLRCDYSGWTGLGNLRANGHPRGGPWRQLHGVACGAYFLERRTALRCMARVWRPSGSCGPWALWLRAWACARSPGALRSILIRSWCG